jgi:ABC-2 type transport system permease protein
MTATTHDDVRLDLGGQVRGEILKAQGLRSVRWLVVAALVLPVACAALTALTTDTAGASHDDLVAVALSSVTDLSWIPVLVVIMLGTVVATSEYENGAMLTTFAASPRRSRVVVAKVLVIATTVLLAGIASSVVSYVAAGLILGGDRPATLADVDVVRVLLGTAYYAAAAATIAACIGLLVRSSIGAVSATLGFLYVLPALLQAVPVEAVDWFARTIPGPASSTLELPGAAEARLGLLTAAVSVLVWTVLWVVAACAGLRRRDV